MKKVSIVIPAMNEEVSLRLVLEEVMDTINKMNNFEFEVILVDDHSTDSTVQVALEYGIKIVKNQRSCGKGNALISGFEATTGEYLIMMDADFSHRAEDFPQFIDTLEKNNDVGLVIGSRLYGGSDEYTRIRAFGNLIFTYLFGVLHNRYLSDALNGFKAFRRCIFTDFKYTSKDFEIEIELLVNTLRKGFKIKEIASHERNRAAGKFKSRVIKHGFKFLMRIISEWIKRKFFHK